MSRSFIFFISLYLYIWLKVNTQLIYHGGETITNFPSFFRGWAFFQQFTSYPGGLTEYLSAFLSQFFYYSSAGALVITLQALLISVCTDYFLKAINAPLLRWVRFIPPILLLITYTRYTYHFATSVALLAALLFVCLYLRVSQKGRLLRLVVFLVLSVILYTIAGGAHLLFVVLCAIYELLFSRQWRIGLVYLLSAAVIPYVEGVLLFGVGIIDAFSELLPFSHKTLTYETRKKMVEIVYVLYLLLPLTALGSGLWRLFVNEKAGKKLRSKFSKRGSNILSWYAGMPLLSWFVESLVLFVLAGTAAFYWHDNKLKTVLEVDYYAYHRMWPQVLDAYHRHPNSYFIVNAVNQALYHTGRLSCDMFSYNQHIDALFLTSKSHVAAFWKKADIYIDLGVMNMGESALAESLERHGEHPLILKRLALINMVKGNLGASRVYLGALSKTLFHADWANSYLDRLDADPNLSTDSQVQHLRRLMLEKDYGFTFYVPEKILLELLEKNRQNQMAFEYLMAWYLLTGQLDRLVQNLDRLNDFDYSGIPRHYEEAILIYEVLTGKKVDLQGRQISQNTYERARGFSNICERFRGKNNNAATQAMRAVAKDYGDTYFFYYNFGSLGIAK